MLYKIFYVFSWILIFQLQLFANWNAVTVSDTVYQFGDVNCGVQHNATLTLENNSDYSVNIISARFELAEFGTDLTAQEVSAQSSISFDIFFESEQNVNYKDFLQIETDAGLHPLIVEVSANGVYDNSYYDATQNLWGTELKSELHNIIDGHTELSYSGVWTALKETDEDPNNTDNVILLYTGWSYAKSDQNTGDQNGWNREHTWAKSHGDFDTDPPAGTDVHHLRPTDVTVNSKRGNLDFDNGGSLYTDDNGVTGCYYDSDSWEPRDEVKGDVARMMFYMTVRYEGDDTSYDLELVDSVPSTSGKDPIFGKQSTLYSWHQADTVSAWERRRNDLIYTNWQHNRNPFIDYPALADRLPSVSGVELTEGPEISVAPSSVTIPEVNLNSDAEYYLAIINTGNQNLNVSTIQSSSDKFTLETGSLVVAAGSFEYVKIHFAGQSVSDTYSANITINSDDSDESEIVVPVSVYVNSGMNVVESIKLPGTVQLHQNYPNPFNPTTNISYTIPAEIGGSAQVLLEVYDLNGKRVETLVNATQQAKTYTLTFTRNDLASSVYFYKLSVKAKGKEYRQVRKMLLMQ